ncbi:MAG: site-specific DNA-methyltransferase [Leptospiraceae bacterium]|nr:site-specific DNA-methyltransferase [Leptospiraceae bacterium]
MKKDYSNWSKEELIKELRNVEKRKKYGIVWEDKPEQVALLCKEKLPILEENVSKEIMTDKEKPTHVLIEGDNYHTLSVLNYTHKGKIDVIYIDPPYNTGAKTWKYNNNYVDKEDQWRHSKWLSFMEKRLKLAKNLISNKGFLICSIDDNELFSLGLLLDEIFGENNRVGLITVLHNPKGRNFTKWFSANSEYMLVYAKDSSIASFNEIALDEEIKKTFNLIDEKGKNYRLEPLMRSRTETLRKNKPRFWYPIYVSKDLKHISLKKIEGYSEVFPIAANGKEATWINLPETFEEKNKEKMFIAKLEDKKIQIYRKFYEQQILKNVWTDKKYQSEFHGTNLLKELLGKNIFEYPKSLWLLVDILKITSKKNSTILDFFAGSGTTGHAVLELNKNDKGTRKFILSTNNENNNGNGGGIAEEVCYPRIKKVISNLKKESNEKLVKNMPGNLKYFKTSFIDAEPTDKNKREMVEKSTEMLCLKEDCFEEVKKEKNFKIFSNNQGKMLGIVYDDEGIELFKKEVKEINKKFVVYIFSLDESAREEEFEDVKKLVELKPIPAVILNVYKRIFK